jgi:hypothetical protein
MMQMLMGINVLGPTNIIVSFIALHILVVSVMGYLRPQ